MGLFGMFTGGKRPANKTKDRPAAALPAHDIPLATLSQQPLDPYDFVYQVSCCLLDLHLKLQDTNVVPKPLSTETLLAHIKVNLIYLYSIVVDPQDRNIHTTIHDLFPHQDICKLQELLQQCPSFGSVEDFELFLQNRYDFSNSVTTVIKQSINQVIDRANRVYQKMFKHLIMSYNLCTIHGFKYYGITQDLKDDFNHLPQLDKTFTHKSLVSLNYYVAFFKEVFSNYNQETAVGLAAGYNFLKTVIATPEYAAKIPQGEAAVKDDVSFWDRIKTENIRRRQMIERTTSSSFTFG